MTAALLAATAASSSA